MYIAPVKRKGGVQKEKSLAGKVCEISRQNPRERGSGCQVCGNKSSVPIEAVKIAASRAVYC